MLQPYILKYFSAQKESFFNNYKLALKTTDVETIHDLRVSIKRMDTLFRMLNYNTNTNFRLKQSFKPIKLVFKKTGKIRDFQIFVKLLEMFQQEMEFDYSSIISRCTHKAENLAEDFMKSTQLSNYQLLRRNLNTFERYINLQSDPELIRKMEGQRRFSEKIYNNYSNPNNENLNLHRARKAIKDLSYLIEMLYTENEAVEELQIKYKQFGRLLGDWHDLATLHNFLVSSAEKSISTGTNLEMMIGKVKTVKDKLKMDFQSINTTIKIQDG